MDIKEIAYGSELYESTKRFREEVLRRPLGLDLTAEDVEGESEQIHIAALENDGTGASIVVGTVLLVPLSAGRVKLRQMGISPDLQGTGSGRKVVEFAEALARQKQFQIMEMHARVYAQGFYEKLGYRTEGEQFIEVTIPTIKMTKVL